MITDKEVHARTRVVAATGMPDRSESSRKNATTSYKVLRNPNL